MKLNEYARIKPSLEPPWDDLREQRVLTRVVEANRQRLVRARGLLATPTRKLLVIAPTIAAAAAAAFMLRSAPVPPTGTEPSVAQSPPSAVGQATGVVVAPEHLMALADGSKAVLLREAGLQVEEQRSDRVRIHQKRGEVRYEVRPDPAREFTVRAGNTAIRVRGTVFTVDLKNDTLEVRVQRGKVEVDDGTRTRDLVAGESLRAPMPQGEAENEVDAMAADAAVVDPANNASGANNARSSGVGVGVGTAPRSAAALQAHADAARLAGRNAEAATSLDKLVRTFPSDARVPAALFSLGRVERGRGQLEASARAFERCASAAPSGPLAGDALAEAAASWSSAGSTRAAKAAAAKYLARHPSGPSAAKMRAIMGP